MVKGRKEPESEILLRFAGEGDMATLLGLIKELAAYENLSHEVTADEETLRRSFFGDRRVAEAILSEVGSEVVGYAIFFHNFSTFKGKPGLYLEDIFVKPPFRGKGIGRRLFCRVAEIAKERGCVRLEWAVLNWNEPALRFYSHFGAVPLREWTVLRLTQREIDEISCPPSE